MSSDWFQYDWDTAYIGNKRWHIHSTSSTQDFIKTKIPETKTEGALVVADYQSSGRGRFGQAWIATVGNSILCSVLLKPCMLSSDIDYSRLTLITQIMSLAICQTITDETSLDVAFKWPNDVLIDGKKCAGIMIETTDYQGELMVILGFGLNVNQDVHHFLTDQYRHRTSLFIETGLTWQRPRLLMKMMQSFELLYEIYKTKANSCLVDRLECYLAWKGEQVIYRNKMQWCRGRILGLDEHGYLCLDNGNKIDMMRAGEVHQCG